MKAAAKGYVVISLAVVMSLLALILFTSIQNQVRLFSVSLIKAKVVSEAQFGVEAIAEEIYKAYVNASVKPHGVQPDVAPFPLIPLATYKRPQDPTDPVEFHPVKSTGRTTDVFLFYQGNEICFKRPINSNFSDMTPPICVRLPTDFLAQNKDLDLTWKEYSAFFLYYIQQAVSLPAAVAQTNLSDPGTAALTALSFDLEFQANEVNFVRDYVSLRCDGSNPNVDCFRFRLCLRIIRSTCDEGNGNERFAIQTIVVNRPPQTTLGQ